jgi:hypothetical protein
MDSETKAPHLAHYVRVRIFSGLARHSRNPRILTRLWKLAGLHFEGRELRDSCVFDAPDHVSIGDGSFVK